MPLSLRQSSLLALAALLCSCDRGLQRAFLPNQPPAIEMAAPILESTSSTIHTYRVSWRGTDVDGRLDHYLYAIDPASVDRVDERWQATRATSLALSAPAFSGPRPAPHVFAVRAVDDQGALSNAVWVSYATNNLPPYVEILQPAPTNLGPITVPPTIAIRWDGVDPDGQSTTKPVKYKFRLFTTNNPDFPGIPDFIAFALSHPDSLRKLYAPGFAGWDSTGPDSTSVTYANLTPGQFYLFAITCFDEAGDYDPIFSLVANLEEFAVVEPCSTGPQLCLFGDNFNFCYATPSCSSDPSRYVTVEMPSDVPVHVQWRALPILGSQIRAYRWVLDPADLQDETPRSDEQSDWYHWSTWSLNTTEAVVGPMVVHETKRQSHLLFVQVEDTNGLRSLGIVNLILVPPTFTEDLLFVNDTRLRPDMVAQGVPQPPLGPWPTAAELDTFLFARGGFPWRNYPPGTMSDPGIFTGYHFDTLGTRRLTTGIVPLSTLASYRTVVWMVNDIGATYTGSPSDPLQPITVLRRITSPGQADILATYLKQGGRVWLMGGGAAYATLTAWNRRNTPPDEFTHFDNELVAGRFMYDFAHWRSALMVRPARFALMNVPEMNPPYPNAAPGRDWSGQGVHHDLSMPDYQKLRDPANGVPFLSPKTCATDPPPPLRACDGFYLLTSYTGEFMGTLSSPGLPNEIVEDADPDPTVVNAQSTLDTLYFVSGGTAPYGRPIMTYYHGFECPQMVFSGFPPWFFQRQQATRLSQFVLTDIFQLTRDGTPAPVTNLGHSATISARDLRLRPTTP